MNLKTHAIKIIILVITATVVIIGFSLPTKTTHINTPVSVPTSRIPKIINTQEQKNVSNLSCPIMQGDESVCTMKYEPVCAEVQIQCITTPCNPVPQTFSNSCTACGNPLVSSYTEGECIK